MYKILQKDVLSPSIKLMKILAPNVAYKAEPGQFVILRIDEFGERIPLTIADFDANNGTITVIFQEVGKTTTQLGNMNAGDSIKDFLGPLGVPIHIKKYGEVVCIGGGVGVAPLFPQARALNNAGNEVISIIGARSKNILFWEDEIHRVSNKLYITTDDGSYGHHGFVSDILKRLIEEKEKIDKVIAIGPIPMMRVVSEVTRPYNIPTVVSLNSIMVDGTGMCGCCRVTVGNEIKFTCVEGPDFDGHQVDFKELSSRMRRFIPQEKQSLEIFRNRRNCLCR
ncbi:MAG: sulfide/dihydroorotate dehydrogenase-like FAD/NAD-binding protein [Candidatus Firestonebacteria bacterium]|nr:sulfide/dihydroorotate dehydrogenase-like FAD/NAD-binding protein [Candidatus Firestonebacteria bacterium]